MDENRLFLSVLACILLAAGPTGCRNECRALCEERQDECDEIYEHLDCDESCDAAHDVADDADCEEELNAAMDCALDQDDICGYEDCEDEQEDYLDCTLEYCAEASSSERLGCPGDCVALCERNIDECGGDTDYDCPDGCEDAEDAADAADCWEEFYELMVCVAVSEDLCDADDCDREAERYGACITA